MAHKPVFAGLIVDEAGNPVEVTTIDDEPYYVINDAGFLHHVPTVDVDRPVLQQFASFVSEHSDILSEQAAKMMGQEDIFSRAYLETQLKSFDQQLETLLESGLPEEVRAYLGMMGFRIVINYHGEVVRIEQPTSYEEGGEGDE
jgi:hypothetical protein